MPKDTNDEMNGVIDFAGACKHLYVWEIVYSRVYTASACLTDEIERTCYIERDLYMKRRAFGFLAGNNYINIYIRK